MFKILVIIVISGYATTKVIYNIPIIYIDQDSNNECNITTINYTNPICDRRYYYITHGYNAGYNSSEFIKLSEALISRGFNTYFVVWERLAANLLYFPTDTEFVGNCLGNFLLQNIYKNCTPLFIHLIGHSLGAHVVGATGRTFRAWGREIDVITGLDPAGPGFYDWKKGASLTPNDALLVIHVRTNANFFGTSENLGKVNFYFNGGVMQPGCSDITCSHDRSLFYQVEAILYNDFIATTCIILFGNVFTFGGDSGRLIFNNNIRSNAFGTYCLRTNSKSPYGLGHA